MAGPPANARIRRDVMSVVETIPAGRVSTHGDIGRRLAIAPRLVASILSMLGDSERETVPWWRVVADGGAIGRHRWRDAQIARLRAEGIPVAPAGIVRELAERRVRSLGASKPPARPKPAPAPEAAPTPRSRARGMKSHPVKPAT